MWDGLSGIGKRKYRGRTVCGFCGTFTDTKKLSQRKERGRVIGMVRIRINGEEKLYEEGIKYEIIAKEYQHLYQEPIALVFVDGKIKELMKRVDRDCELGFATYGDAIGHKTYVRSAIMLLMKAIKDVAGFEVAAATKVEFAIGAGYYCRLKDGFSLDNKQIAQIKQRMRELVDADLSITKKAYPVEEALALFEKYHMMDKVKLFRYRRSSTINVYCMGDYFDYYYGFMLPSTGYIECFDLLEYEDGMILLLPEQEVPDKLPVFEPRQKLFQTLLQTCRWGEQIGIDTVGDLNDKICEGNIADMILVQEALQERRIGEIARDIARREGVKFVMIAGPSSSGKTTFAHRLSIQLRTYGLRPHPIGLDNYYVNHDSTPRDEDGNPDFECIEALDVEQFNRDMKALLAGETVELPTFNFKTGRREYNGKVTTLGEEDILVIEGIHGLNEKMSYSLPAESKYKIYISALTCLNVDEHNRIPTTDSRLLRRLVRDARTRGASAKRTIEMWQSVRRGEEKYIFPFQEQADAMFNSAMIYELAVLKQYAEPLLFSIEKGEPEYYEAKRLLKFLEYFLGVSSETLPNNSLCREFVGGSCFE
ncbi:MAG: nucleoside kinase [Muribaculaceae bacterium]|nr:nucleoside kinase [Muribaculaceae bacterium]